MAIREHPTSPQALTPPVPASSRRVRWLGSGGQLPLSAPRETLQAAGMLVEAVNSSGTIRLVGELDSSTIGYVRDALLQPMVQSGRLTLDLSQLTFMGSEGIHLFADLARERDGVGVVVLSHPDGMARRLIGLGQLDKLPNLRIDPATEPTRTDVSGRFPPNSSRLGAPG